MTLDQLSQILAISSPKCLQSCSLLISDILKIIIIRVRNYICNIYVFSNKLPGHLLQIQVCFLFVFLFVCLFVCSATEGKHAFLLAKFLYFCVRKVPFDTRS